MKMLEFLFVPTILFMTIVAPIWIAMHYNSSRKSSRSLDQGDREVIEELLADLDKMTGRIAALESILDQENPSWRDEHSNSHRDDPSGALKRRSANE